MDIELTSRKIFLQVIFRLVAAEKLREKIAEEAKERQRESGGDKRSEGYRQDQLCPIGHNRSEQKDKSTTRKELAKIAGVSEGTVSRYDRVMQSTYQSK